MTGSISFFGKIPTPFGHRAPGINRTAGQIYIAVIILIPFQIDRRFTVFRISAGNGKCRSQIFYRTLYDDVLYFSVDSKLPSLIHAALLMQIDIFMFDFQPFDFKIVGNFRVKLRGNTQNTLGSGSFALPGQFPVIIADLINSNLKSGIIAEFFYIVARRVRFVCLIFANRLVQKIHAGILSVDFYFLFVNIFLAGDNRIKFLLIAILPKNIVTNSAILSGIFSSVYRIIQCEFQRCNTSFYFFCFQII